MVDRSPREEETFGDVPVPEPFGHELEHLDLAGRELRRVRLRRCAWAARDVEDPELAEPARDHRRERACAELSRALEGEAERGLVVGSREAERLFVGTAERGP